MALNQTTQTFDTIASVRLSKGSANTKVNVLGYGAINDGGGGQYYWDASSTAIDNGGSVIKVTAIATGRYILNYKEVINAAQFGVVTGDGSESENAQLVAALATDGVKKVIFNSLTIKSYIITYDIVVPTGVILSFDNDNKLIGSGSISGGRVDCDFQKQCFGGDLIVTNLENNVVSSGWFGLVADYKIDNTTVTPTDNSVAFQMAIDARKDIFTSDEFYKVRGKMYIPAPPVTGYGYYVGNQLVADAMMEIYGDGIEQSILFFPPTLGKPAIYVKFADIVPPYDFKGGKKLYAHDFSMYGNGYGHESAAYDDNVSQGIFIETPENTFERVRIQGFNSDGIRLNASTAASPPTVGNLNRIINCEIFRNGGHGLAVPNGYDANQCYFEQNNFSSNARFGKYENSSLGSNYVGNHTAGNGILHTQNRTAVSSGGKGYWCIKGNGTGKVSNKGNRYQCILENVDIEPGVTAGWTTYWTLIGAGAVSSLYAMWFERTNYTASPVQPAVTSGWVTYWYLYSLDAPPSSYYHAWSNTFPAYDRGGSTLALGASQVTPYIGEYSEFGEPPFTNESGSLVVGGTACIVGQTTLGISSLQGVVTVTKTLQAWNRSTGIAAYFNSTDSAGTDIGFRDPVGGQRSCFNYDPNYGIGFSTNGGGYGMLLIPSTASAGVIAYTGRSALPSVGIVTARFGIFTGVDESGISFRMTGVATASPTTGVHAEGDYVRNANATIGSTLGWHCTVAGTPGTWVAIINASGGVGTVTSIGIALGTSGTDIGVSGSPVTSSGNITLNVPTASASNRGLLSSTDWSTFNSKGSGTVTSVGITLGTSGTDIGVSGSPVTGSGAITLNVPTSSASNRGLLSSTDWSTFNSKESALTFSTGLVRTTNTITNTIATGLAGSQTIYGGTAANEDLTVQGTVHATKTTSYVNIQPDGGYVGIGTSTPGNAFYVHNAVANDAVVTFEGQAIGLAHVNNGSIALGNTAAFQGRVQYDATLATATLFLDNTYNSTSSAIKLRLRTSGSPVTALTALGDGTITIPNLAGSGTRLVVADSGGILSTETVAQLGLVTGSYTPTLTNVANVSASTAYLCYYYQVLDMVTVFGKVDIDPTLTATATELGVSLPVASGLTGDGELAGTAASNIAAEAISISGDGTNDRAAFKYLCTDITNHTLRFHFSYKYTAP